jgi:hypothetical protein
MLIVSGLSIISCKPKPIKESIPIPFQEINIPRGPVSTMISPPPSVAVMVDVSGSMKRYTKYEHREGALTYIIRNLHTIWIPSAEVKRDGSIKRYSVGYVYQVGTDLYNVSVNNFQQVVNLPCPKDFEDCREYTSLHRATKKAAILLDQRKPQVSMVILISDLQTEIGPIFKECPQGNAPYCVVEQLRSLYEGQEVRPGWWILGVKVPYTYEGKTIWRPIFICVWGYDIEPIRTMLKKIHEDLKMAYKPSKGEAEARLIEIAPSDGWMPDKSGHWVASGKMEYTRGSPFIWFKKEQSFKCSGHKEGEISIQINKYNYSNQDQLESPYKQLLKVEIHSSVLQGCNIAEEEDSNATYQFLLKIPTKSVKGERRKPNEAQITIRAYPKGDLYSLNWIEGWSVRTSSPEQVGSRIINLESLMHGAMQIAPPKFEKITSFPIILKFWK